MTHPSRVVHAVFTARTHRGPIIIGTAYGDQGDVVGSSDVGAQRIRAVEHALGQLNALTFTVPDTPAGSELAARHRGAVRAMTQTLEALLTRLATHHSPER